MGWIDEARVYNRALSLNEIQHLAGITPTYALTVGKTGAGSGTVSSLPSGIDCGVTCTNSFDEDTLVTLTAVPASGSAFTGWSDACTGTGACIVTMDAAKSVTANFAINTFTLNYAAGANGSLSGDIAQVVNYGGDGTAVTAVPAVGYHFVNWSDASTANPRTDTNVMANVDVTANFAVDTFTLNYTAGTGGGLTGNTAQVVNYGGDGTAVTAVAAIGYHFVAWSDTSTANPRTDTNVMANIDVTANFTEISVLGEPSGTNDQLGSFALTGRA